jgi:hypothetical protein
MERDEGIARMVRNGWVHMAVLSPRSAEIRVYRGGAFRRYTPRSGTLPKAATSADWYRGWRDHLEFARITGGPGDVSPPGRAGERR